jgi:hypothetical protein
MHQVYGTYVVVEDYTLQIWVVDDCLTRVGFNPWFNPNSVKRHEAKDFHIVFQCYPTLDRFFEVYDREWGLQSAPNWNPPKPFAADTAVSDVNGVRDPET